MSDNKQPSVLRSLDWWTIGIYLALLAFGWISVCGASYTYGDNEIFSSGCSFGYADCMDWNIDSIGFGSSYARRPVLRYLLVCDLCAC